MQVITLASPTSLPRARALGRSLSRHHPDWSHEVLLLGNEAAARSFERVDDIPRVSSVCRELDLDIEALLALHDEEQLSVLLLPALLRRYAERGGSVLHLPNSAWVLADLSSVEFTMSSRAVTLVPRVVAELPEDGLEPTRTQLERAGRIEAAMIGVDASPEAMTFLEWWDGHVQEMLGSIDARRAGARPEDWPWLARFLELAPARFSTAVVEDPGCNVSMWNLQARTLQPDPEGASVDGRWPLRFLNLPGFEPDRPHRLNPTATRARVSRSPVLHALCERYAQELRDAGWKDEDHREDVGRRLTQGLVFDEPLRALYATASALGLRFEDVFAEEGTRAFLDWLEGPAPRGGAVGINRYVFHRVARERPDVVRTYPDIGGSDGPDYIAWCWAFGRDELSIPEQFMPPRPGAIGPAVPATKSAPANPAKRNAAALKASGTSRAGSGLAVRLTGYLGHALGLGAAARGYAHALRTVGVPVSTTTVPLHHLALPTELGADYGRHEFEDLVHDGAHGFEIVAVNADELPDFVTRLGERYFEGPRIGIWGWETNSIPPRWNRAFGLVDEIWVYSQFMAENIGAAAPVPVLRLPPPVQRPDLDAPPTRLGVGGGFLFLFVFDYLSTIQRKNPVGLIEAFKSAFAPGEGPQLLIKTINAPLRPLAEEEVLWAAHGRPDVHVLDRSLSGRELSGLMAACDCYASMHRAEGFGLTMAEAMAIGKPVIATGYSGNVDFMTAENSYLVDFQMGRVGPDCEIYPAEGEWAEPSVEHAAELMRRVCSTPHEAAAKGARASEDVERLLSPAVTGRNMRQRLEQLAGVPASDAEHAVSSR
jgi:glycosyltransferase involved in cell wall biosynthesis